MAYAQKTVPVRARGANPGNRKRVGKKSPVFER